MLAGFGGPPTPRMTVSMSCHIWNMRRPHFVSIYIKLDCDTNAQRELLSSFFQDMVKFIRFNVSPTRVCWKENKRCARAPQASREIIITLCALELSRRIFIAVSTSNLITLIKNCAPTCGKSLRRSLSAKDVLFSIYIHHSPTHLLFMYMWTCVLLGINKYIFMGTAFNKEVHDMQITSPYEKQAHVGN